ncbi:dCTP deaminase [Methanopyrus sp.]
MLSDRDIKRALEEGDIVVKPLEEEYLEEALGPASLDLRLGNEFVVFKTLHKPCIDPTVDAGENTERIVIDEDEEFVINPGELVLAITHEWIEINAPDITGVLHGRSSLGRLGIQAHVEAGYVDPGWRGRLTLELVNFNPMPVKLRPGMRVVQIVFHRLSSPAERTYAESSGKYHGDRRPSPSKMHLDFCRG